MRQKRAVTGEGGMLGLVDLHSHMSFSPSSTLVGSTPVMLFDGDCGICSWSAERARRIAQRSGYRVEPYFAFSEEQLADVGLTYEACTVKLKVVAPGGRVWGGAFAVNHFLWKHPPLSVIPVIVAVLFPLLLVEVVLYKVVARNRHRISRWLGMTACAVRPHI